MYVSSCTSRTLSPGARAARASRAHREAKEQARLPHAAVADELRRHSVVSTRAVSGGSQAATHQQLEEVVAAVRGETNGSFTGPSVRKLSGTDALGTHYSGFILLRAARTEAEGA